MRQHAGVVEQLLPIDARVGKILKTLKEKLQRLPMIDGDQFP
jgi:hypothetical protein